MVKEIECKNFWPRQTLFVSSPFFRLNIPPIEVVMQSEKARHKRKNCSYIRSIFLRSSSIHLAGDQL